LKLAPATDLSGQWRGKHQRRQQRQNFNRATLRQRHMQ
jgi:hypothetical protein